MHSVFHLFEILPNNDKVIYHLNQETAVRQTAVPGGIGYCSLQITTAYSTYQASHCKTYFSPNFPFYILFTFLFLILFLHKSRLYEINSFHIQLISFLLWLYLFELELAAQYH